MMGDSCAYGEGGVVFGCSQKRLNQLKKKGG